MTDLRFKVKTLETRLPVTTFKTDAVEKEDLFRKCKEHPQNCFVCMCYSAQLLCICVI